MRTVIDVADLVGRPWEEMHCGTAVLAVAARLGVTAEASPKSVVEAESILSSWVIGGYSPFEVITPEEFEMGPRVGDVLHSAVSEDGYSHVGIVVDLNRRRMLSSYIQGGVRIVPWRAIKPERVYRIREGSEL